jgi:hypothetical protein
VKKDENKDTLLPKSPGIRDAEETALKGTLKPPDRWPDARIQRLVRVVYRLRGTNSNNNYGACQGQDDWRTLAANKGALLTEAWPATLFDDSARAYGVSNLNQRLSSFPCTSPYKSSLYVNTRLLEDTRYTISKS